MFLVSIVARQYDTKKKKTPIGEDECFLLEGPVGLEPTTPCLKGRCSNRLSYGPIALSKKENNSLHYPYFG